MAEVLAVLGGVGSIFSIVDGISKVIGIIRDLQTRWGEADLTLLSLASQLTALRAASTKIQEWIDQDLQDNHHQLVMDLDVSVSCCKLLMNKIESFFTNLAQLTEKPLDLRDKYKVAFGSSGPESVQRLIEHQTSSLTLLLTACNCKTISEQQRYLGTHKTRKVLDRAKADSMSLYVHRDSASLTSRITDNMSKISRIFDFDSDIFSSGVYERAFRGSVRDLLKRRQQTLRSHPPIPSIPESTMTVKSLHNICLLGPDQIGMDLLVNTIPIDRDTALDEWTLHQWEMRKLFLNLVAIIAGSGSILSISEDIRTVRWFMKTEQYLAQEHYSETDLMTADALQACTRIWRGAVQYEQEFHAYNASGKKIEFKNMLFWVAEIPDRGLSITSGNYAATFFVHRLERILHANGIIGFQETAPLAELLRGAETAFEDVAFQFPIGYPGSMKVVKTSIGHAEDETAYVLFVDLKDWNLGMMFQRRAVERLLASVNVLFTHQKPVIGLVLRHSGMSSQQTRTSDLLSQVGRTTNDGAKAISHITMVLKDYLKIDDWDFSFILNEAGDAHSARTLVRLKEIISSIRVRTGSSSLD